MCCMYPWSIVLWIQKYKGSWTTSCWRQSRILSRALTSLVGHVANTKCALLEGGAL
jgi:hypothetical protein